MRRRLNIGVFFTTLLLAVISCKSYKPLSGNPNYRPLKEFKGDTLAYLNYNFNIHKDFYIGKRFDVLLHDIEGTPAAIPNSRYIRKHKKRVISSASISIEKKESYFIPSNYRTTYEDGIYVDFNDSVLISIEEFWKYREELVASEPNLTLNINLKELWNRLGFYLSDCIISNIEVSRTDWDGGYKNVKNKEQCIWNYLQSDEWERYSKYEKLKEHEIIKFSKDTLYIYKEKKGKKEYKKQPYYLEYSKKLGTEFQSEKVGKNSRGNRLVTKEETGNTTIFEIIYFTDEELRLRTIETGELLDFKKKENKKK